MTTEATPTVALGIELQLLPTSGGGRRTPLAGGNDRSAIFTYRPNWGLPGMVHPDQTGAFVFGFSRSDIAPGETVRAVIVPPFPDIVASWEAVAEGDTLKLYEGPDVRGSALVLWRAATTLPMTEADEDRFATWLVSGASPPNAGPDV